MKLLSIIIPVLNEEALIANQIASVREVAPEAELVVVDGGSIDRTAQIAKECADHFVITEPGRAVQMNIGAQQATGKYLLFLHVDTTLPDQLSEFISDWVSTQPVWGYFSLRLSGNAAIFRLIEFMINLRTKLTGGATGDQCQIFRADAFTSVGGFPQMPLMEDLAMSRRLRKIVPPKIVAATVESSSRRWEERGIARTVLLMWLLRGLYTLGIHPRYFFKVYR